MDALSNEVWQGQRGRSPLPPIQKHKVTFRKIVEKVRESRKAWEQSKKLLEVAKTGVEQAIETASYLESAMPLLVRVTQLN